MTPVALYAAAPCAMMHGALMEGGRSFAEFALADDILTQHGFRIGDYQGDVLRDPAFALVRSRSRYFVDPGDCVIEPIAHGRYCLSMTLDDDAEYVVECDNLTKARLLFRPFERGCFNRSHA